MLVLKVIPKNILEAEKFELLSKEEVEKTAKEMVKIDILKGEFMNIAAHELKTPLVPLINYLEMLLDDKSLQKKHKDKIKICLAAARREVELVSDILDISKLEAGSFKIETEQLSVNELLREASESLEPAVTMGKLAFKTKIEPNLPLIEADKRRVIQVISNLVTNAIKFTDKGSITIGAKKIKGFIQISVTDTGIGISKKNLKKLFTKFSQVDTSAKRRSKGTGLGLAISKGIVQKHGGKIWVESVEGKGTSFNFTLPFLSSASKIKSKSKKVEEEKDVTETEEKPAEETKMAKKETKNKKSAKKKNVKKSQPKKHLKKKKSSKKKKKSIKSKKKRK